MLDLPRVDGGYGAILADPPWTFATYSAKGKGRSAEAHYDCMTLEQIEGLAVSDVAAKDCVLFMWATDPLLPAALRVIEAWGFKYKTVGFYWAKSTKAKLDINERLLEVFVSSGAHPIGTGYWTRANPEMCLLATRGHPKRQSRRVRKLMVEPRREHSRKPDLVYDRIEALVGGPYLELFSRQRQPGWDSWGLEVDTGIAPRRAA